MRRGSDRSASRRGGRPERPASQRPPLPKTIIVCEGKRTEPLYFQAIRRTLRLTAVQLDIISAEGSNPHRIVSRAVEVRTQTLREYKANEVAVWAVYDGDYAHKAREEWEPARRLAKQNSIQEAITTPCFELWYLLHFRDQTGLLSSDQAIRRLENHVPNYEKSNVLYPDPLATLTEEAIRRAEGNHQQAELNGWEVQDYACAMGVAQLVKFLLGLGR